MFLGVSELARFGQLLLQDGNWDGHQLIPADYIREASSVQVDNGSFGYGYLFWRGPWDSYRADGKYGQLAIVLKKENAVIAVNAESRDPQMMERCMNVIMPQLV